MKCRRLLGCVVALMVLIGRTVAWAGDDSRANRGGQLAQDILAVSRLLAIRHYEPPARQQVVLLAARAIYKARKASPPADLVVRCSVAVSDEHLGAILREASGPDFVLDSQARRGIAEAIAASVPGGFQLLSKKAGTAERQLAENRYVGVGIAARVSQDREFQVGAVMPGGPMERAGVPESTVIKTIDGRSTRDLSIEECVERLRGPEGTSVVLTIRRPGSDSDESLTLERGVVPQKTFTPEIATASGRQIAILRPRQISGSLAHEIQQFAQAAPELDGLLLDLRGVSGPGHFAALVADQFLVKGSMGATRTAERRISLKAQPGEVFADVPIAVATDKGTRGGAAWLATVLMERKRAEVFGQKGDQPNLDFETLDLPSGELAVTFATRILESPSGLTMLAVSETTQIAPSEVVVNDPAVDGARPIETSPPTASDFENAAPEQRRQTLKLPRLHARDSFAVAKEYLEYRRDRKGS